MMKRVAVYGGFDDIRSRHVRFLHEASRLGTVHVLLPTDQALQVLTGKAPKFPLEERRYFLESLRYVSTVTVTEQAADPDTLPPEAADPDIWAIEKDGGEDGKIAFCESSGMQFHLIDDSMTAGFPDDGELTHKQGRKKVIVTGCFDWFHTGHIRFFEEVAGLGELYVVVGSDRNVKLLKGEGHPLFGEQERRYMVQSIRHVHRALVSTGSGWMDAEPEIDIIHPHIYVVNEDGDKPEKREFCERLGIEYKVLQRIPKEGLPKRDSTDLRGF